VRVALFGAIARSWRHSARHFAVEASTSRAFLRSRSRVRVPALRRDPRFDLRPPPAQRAPELDRLRHASLVAQHAQRARVELEQRAQVRGGQQLARGRAVRGRGASERVERLSCSAPPQRSARPAPASPAQLPRAARRAAPRRPRRSARAAPGRARRGPTGKPRQSRRRSPRRGTRGGRRCRHCEAALGPTLRLRSSPALSLRARAHGSSPRSRSCATTCRSISTWHSAENGRASA
jgi:hypothetical protein